MRPTARPDGLEPRGKGDCGSGRIGLQSRERTVFERGCDATAGRRQAFAATHFEYLIDLDESCCVSGDSG
jgi:hypothetical protein